MADPRDPCELSVIVPIFRGAELVAPSVARLVEGLTPTVPDFEVVLVDDGSGDGTADAVRRAAASDDRVRGVVLERNQGKGGAVAAGMLSARGLVRAFTDADVPFGTGPIVAMHRAIRAGDADVAVGDRRLAASRYYEAVPPLRRFASYVFTEVVSLLAPCDASDTQCGVKALDGEVAAHIFPILRERGFAFDAEMLYLCRKYGLRVAREPVSLLHTGPSTVSLTRVALPMLASVAQLRLRWRTGGYREPWLAARGARRRPGGGA